ncbi:MAG: MotA/TolQ/ExbB proton channel family protein [Pirellulales bacterium]|nr:MotA/TolQ/ExbB proton channel family protein [Pirellulales bacterium]
MSRVTSFSEWLLRQAFIWGGLACLAFYALVVRSAPEGEFLQRYFAGHPIAYCATALFFVGLAALVIKLLGLSLQFATLESVQLPTAATGSETVDDVPGLLESLSHASGALQDSYLGSRLRGALQYIQQKGSADELEPQLRHLEENDVAKMHQGYAMVRIILSTIPILGFLGTVIGITLAIGKMDLSGDAMEKSLPAVVSGLSVAFDTTALALSLSTVLLFVKFCVERVESRLLTAVDAKTSRELVGRFRQYGTQNDPHLASIRQMSEKMLQTIETGINKQASLLQRSLENTGKQCADIMANTASALDEAISGAVVEGLSRHAEALNEGVKNHTGDLEEMLIRHAELLNEGLGQHTAVLSKSLEHHRKALTEAEKQLAQENRQHLAEVEAAVGEAMLVATSRQEKLIEQSETLLKQMQQALIESAGSTVAQQEQLIKQGDVLLKVVEATGQIKQLEDTLNNNLNALAGAHGFRETAAALSAALQVIGARLGQPVALTSETESRPARNQNQAA